MALAHLAGPLTVLNPSRLAYILIRRSISKMHKQSNLNHGRDKEVQASADSNLYSPKSEKPKSLPKSMHYVLKERRWLFVLVGTLIASTIFILQPSLPKRDIRKDICGAEKFLSNGEGNSGVQETTTVSKIVGGVKRKPLRIVVQGVAGFVGNHLVDRLLERGDNVIVNIEQKLNNEGLHFKYNL